MKELSTVVVRVTRSARGSVPCGNSRAKVDAAAFLSIVDQQGEQAHVINFQLAN